MKGITRKRFGHNIDGKEINILRVGYLLLTKKGKWLTVIDRLGAPGDTIITANIIHGIKQLFPKLKINCITPNPELIKLDPDIDCINQKETFYSFRFLILGTHCAKRKKENIVSFNLGRLGINGIKYKARFYLTNDEIAWAKKLLHKETKPILAVCSKSKEPVKNWPTTYWQTLIEKLKSIFILFN